ncbi:MAG: tetratricopeptide repeat protein [Gammaproteobacteria bacterium]|nr:tetratricopeptide repeat protein [Gammaproteobacteria bacterium]NNJ95649.1 tetratricopeptide repeat protein [Gammaproteobacteria bacterium]
MKLHAHSYRYVIIATVSCALAAISACTTQTAKISTIKKGEVVTVDGDVQRSFDQALQLLQAEQYDTAIEMLDKVVEQENRLTAPYINLAMAYRHKGDEKMTEEYLLKALEIDQSQPVANNELGILYRKQGRFVDARNVYTNALSENPDYLPAIRNLGILCDLYLRDVQCALEQFEKYQKQDPNDKTIEIWIADLKTRM